MSQAIKFSILITFINIIILCFLYSFSNCETKTKTAEEKKAEDIFKLYKECISQATTNRDYGYENCNKIKQ